MVECEILGWLVGWLVGWIFVRWLVCVIDWFTFFFGWFCGFILSIVTVGVYCTFVQSCVVMFSCFAIVS